MKNSNKLIALSANFGAIMHGGYGRYSFVAHIRLEIALKMAERSGLDFYSAGVHYEKAGCLLRGMGREEGAINMFKLSSKKFEDEAVVLSSLMRSPGLIDGDVANDPLGAAVIDCLNRASLNADLANDYGRKEDFRKTAQTIRAVPAFAEVIFSLARSK